MTLNPKKQLLRMKLIQELNATKVIKKCYMSDEKWYDKMLKKYEERAHYLSQVQDDEIALFDGKWIYAEELKFLQSSTSWKFAMRWLKHQDGKYLAKLIRLIIKAATHGQLMCFKAIDGVEGSHELLSLDPGDNVLVLYSIDHSLILCMSMEQKHAHYLREVQDGMALFAKKHYQEGKGVLAHIGIKYFIPPNGMVQILDCGFALAGALSQSSQQSDQGRLMRTLREAGALSQSSQQSDQRRLMRTLREELVNMPSMWLQAILPVA